MATTLSLVERRPPTVPTFVSLSDALVAEDHAEDTGRLDPLDRLTCRVHRRWIHECCHSDMHVIQVTGNRWCRPCRRALEIAVDELNRTVTVHCPRCDRGPSTRADQQLIAACEASLTAARSPRPPGPGACQAAA
ncbi:MAG: hypothetical protein ABW224_14355 [Kibdelosporangium sp.]